MTKSTLISIIIPCYNEAEGLAALYAALVQATKDSPEQFEFIFVDDGSKDGTAELVRELTLSGQLRDNFQERAKPLFLFESTSPKPGGSRSLCL